MKLIKNFTPKKRIEYKHFVTYKRKKYIREEYVMPQSFKWQSTPDKLEDHHTIAWKSFNNNEYNKNGDIEYYSCDMGWAKNGKLAKSNPVPAIEKEFKKTIGKDLIYFPEIKKKCKHKHTASVAGIITCLDCNETLCDY